jgi:phytoene dehydrogenase-like protein
MSFWARGFSRSSPATGAHVPVQVSRHVAVPCPSLISILSILEYEHGIFHLIGGCNALPLGMARVVMELGASIRLNEPVEEILFDGRRAVGARTATGEGRAEAVVMNADFGHAMTKIVPQRHRRKWTDATLARKRFSCSTFMLYLGIEGRCGELQHHNILVAKNYRQKFAEIRPPLLPRAVGITALIKPLGFGIHRVFLGLVETKGGVMVGADPGPLRVAGT